MNKMDKKASAIESVGIVKSLHKGDKEAALSSLDSIIDHVVWTSYFHLQEMDREEVIAFLKTVKQLRKKYPRILRLTPSLDHGPPNLRWILNLFFA